MTLNASAGRNGCKAGFYSPRLDGARIVVAAIYQHVWSAAKTLQANKDDRAQVLSALAKVVRRVPKRDSFFIAGDFNTSLRPHPALIGQRALTPAEVRPDEQNLTNLLVKLRLVALNTWQCAQAHTYEQGATATQIDYILTEEPRAGSKAKRSGPWRDCPLGSWTDEHPGRSTMWRHYRNLFACTTAGHRRCNSGSRTACSRVGLECIADAGYGIVLSEACSQQGCPAGCSHQTHVEIKSCKSEHWFPSPPSTQLSGPLVAQPTLPHGGEQSDTGSQRLELAQAEHKQAVRQSKKDRIARFPEEVDLSLAEGDQHLAFKTLKLLQPWKPARRSQLKSKEGNLLGPKQELEALRQYASKVFSAPLPLQILRTYTLSNQARQYLKGRRRRHPSAYAANLSRRP